MLSRWVRRIHLYLALFLIPWMIVYAVSTLLLNHRSDNREQETYVLERQIPADQLQYKGGPPEPFVQRILEYTGETGAFVIGKSALPEEVVIRRMDAIRWKHIHYNAREGFIRIERSVWSPHDFLARLHFRKGFQHNFLQEDLWAFFVDVAALAIIFWSLSGLWMLWEMPATRWLGLAGTLAGMLFFGFLLLTI